jgi:hypothetical protein
MFLIKEITKKSGKVAVFFVNCPLRVSPEFFQRQLYPQKFTEIVSYFTEYFKMRHAPQKIVKDFPEKVSVFLILAKMTNMLCTICPYSSDL